MYAQPYLAYIGVDVSDFPAKSLELLKEIHYKHLLAVPFEGLDVKMNIPLSMDPTIVLNKIIKRCRGAVCLEAGSLLYQVLKELGYDVWIISAQFWNDEVMAWGPHFGHMGLCVKIDQQVYLFDVGVGGAFAEPLPLQEEIHHDRWGDFYFITEKNDEEELLILQQLKRGQIINIIRFNLEPHQVEEFSDMLIQHQTSPDSILVKQKFCTKRTETGKITLLEDRLTIVDQGQVTKQPVHSPEEWNELLQKYFGFSL